MVEQLNPPSKLLSAAKLLVACLLLLRLGGYAPDYIPSAGIWIALLASLLVYERISDELRHAGTTETLLRWREWATTRRFALGLAVITGAALVLRILGINDDLGHVALSIDENRLNASVLYLFRTGDINYRTVEHYPGIHYWMLVGSYLLAYLWGLMTHVGNTLAGMPVHHFAAFGRLVSALQSAATVLLTGLLGRRLAGARAGLLAAAILGLAPLSVNLARQLRNDTAATMLVVAAALLALSVYHSGFKAWQAILAGALAGLAAGVKYTGVFVLLPVLLAAATSQDRGRRGRALGLATCGFLFAALLSNHFVWADIPNLVDQLSDQILITGEGHWAAQANPPAYHVTILAQQVVGWPMLLLGAAVLAYQLAAGNWSWWLFSIYPLLSLWFVSQRPSQLPRWVYPEAPFAAVAAAAGLAALLDVVTGHLPRTARMTAARRAATAGVLVVVALAPLLNSAVNGLSRQLTRPTWTLTEQWLEENAAAGDRILLQRRWLSLDPQRFVLNRQQLDDALDGGLYELAANDWIVVQEEYLGHPALRGLRRVHEVRLDPSLFGNRGPDFIVFQPPPVPPVDLPLEVAMADASVYLGHEWPRAASAGAGRPLPDGGAGLYLPPLGERAARLDILVASPVAGAAPPSLAVQAGATPLDTTSVPDEDGALRFTTELSLRAVGPGVVALTLQPTPDSGPVRVRGFRLY